jgi:hypothetical protein
MSPQSVIELAYSGRVTGENETGFSSVVSVLDFCKVGVWIYWDFRKM